MQPSDTAAQGLLRGVEEFRAVRRGLEQAIAAQATSVDGRRFAFQASLHDLVIQAGGYVALGDRHDLGQVISLQPASGAELDLAVSVGADAAARSQVVLRFARGERVVLEGDGAPFHDVSVRPAGPGEVSEWRDRTRPDRATLEIGEFVLAPGVAFGLDAGGFDRHTFLCGQSGSGKTYSLGVVLERLLVETELRVVVLDPNSDFVRLGRVRAGADPSLTARYRDAAAEITVRAAAGTGGARLRLRLPDLERAAQAALLRLEPIADREEISILASALAEWAPATVDELAAADSPDARRLVHRARNLGADRWGVWGGGDPGSILDEVTDAEARCLVVDLGSLATREEQALVAGAVLARLWERRADRVPTLVVVDEAHNVCPQAPDDALTRLATEHAIRIAGEGRKFGSICSSRLSGPRRCTGTSSRNATTSSSCV